MACFSLRLDLLQHALMSQVFLELTLGEQGNEPAQRKGHGEQPHGDDQHRMHAEGRGDQGMDLGQADCGDRDEHLVERVDGGPAHDHVAGGSVDQH